MTKTISENVRDMNAGDSRAATSGEDKIDFVKDTSDAIRIGGDDVKLSGIRKDMNVIASCGKSLGLVDGVDGPKLQLLFLNLPLTLSHLPPRHGNCVNNSRPAL